MNTNGGITVSKQQKQLIRTGNATERMAVMMSVLEQNVGNFNKEMMNTPMGQYFNTTNKVTDSLIKLGDHTILLKLEFAKLKLSLMPFFTIVIRIASAAIGLVTTGIRKVIEGFNKLSKVFDFMVSSTDGVTKKMGVLKWILRGIAGVVAVMNLGLVAFGIAMIAIEDFWIFLQGGDSIIGRLIDKIKKLATTIKEVFTNNVFVKTLKQAGDMLKTMHENDPNYQPTGGGIQKIQKAPQAAQSVIGKYVLDKNKDTQTKGMNQSVFMQNGAITIQVDGSKNPEETGRAVSNAVNEEINKIWAMEGITK